MSSDVPFLPRWSSRLLAAVGSLQLAVMLIATYAGVLIGATVVESRFGAAAAHFAIYDAGWFTALNVLLAANVLAAMVIRFPWRRRQMGFLVTHLGILVLLAGCLATRQCGIEAQLPVFEGQTAHRAYQESYHFQLQVKPTGPSTAAAAELIDVPFVAGPFSWDRYATLSWFPCAWSTAARGSFMKRTASNWRCSTTRASRSPPRTCGLPSMERRRSSTWPPCPASRSKRNSRWLRPSGAA